MRISDWSSDVCSSDLGVNEVSTGIGLNIVNDCVIVDAGHTRDRDLALELPRSPLSAVMSTEVWGETYDRLAKLVGEHRTTLIFVNQRRQAERVARHLAERIDRKSTRPHSSH